MDTNNSDCKIKSEGEKDHQLQQNVPTKRRSLVLVNKHKQLRAKAIKWIAKTVMVNNRRTISANSIELAKVNSVATCEDSLGQSTNWADTDVVTARQRSKRIRLNIGGHIYEVLLEKLKRLPDSRLGRISLSEDPQEILGLCDDYWPGTNEFYFDRPVYAFAHVIGFYYTGHLHILDEACVVGLEKELAYWGVNENCFDVCCLHRYHQRKEETEDEIRKYVEICATDETEENFGNGLCSNIRKRIWDFVEKPQSSMAARVFAVISILFILLSVIALNLSTIPREISKNNDTTEIQEEYLLPSNYSELIEVICITWFSLEFGIRILVAPNKCAFLKSAMNIIDMIAILPFYLSKIYEALATTSRSIESVQKALLMFRLLRILRVFKLARHSHGLQALGYTLTQSYKELGLLMMFVILVVLVFSSLAYFAEKTENSLQFTSIPATFWWAIITMTTVGYGDITPHTPLGKLIGSICCICGVLVVGLPIPIIVNNFAKFYQNQIRREKVLKHQRMNTSDQRSRHSSGNVKSEDDAVLSHVEVEDKWLHNDRELQPASMDQVANISKLLQPNGHEASDSEELAELHGMCNIARRNRNHVHMSDIHISPC